jgi:SAM-dependent methyltransferase
MTSDDDGKPRRAISMRHCGHGGDVLEIAAGTGNLTRSLAMIESVDRITAIDTSDEALAIARAKVSGLAPVTFLRADVFDLRPIHQFDVVAFGFWLSHVPPGRFERFWTLVRDALRPRGRVFFTDNAVPVEQAAAADSRRVDIPWSRTWIDRGVSIRTLADGREFPIVKRAWTPGDLEHELAALGWSAVVQEHHGLFIHGEAVRPAA